MTGARTHARGHTGLGTQPGPPGGCRGPSPRRSRPGRVLTTQRSAVASPPPASRPPPRRSGVYSQAASWAGEATQHSGGATHPAPPAIPPLHTPHPLPAHGCPPIPTLQTPPNRTPTPPRGGAQTLAPLLTPKERLALTSAPRGPWDAPSRHARLPHAALGSPDRRGPGPRPPPALPQARRGARDQSPAPRPENAEPEPTPQPFESLAGASLAGQSRSANPAPPAGRLPRPGAPRRPGNNVKRRQNAHGGGRPSLPPRRGSSPAPAPRAPRGPGSPRTGGCRLSRRQPSPSPRGRARTLAAAATGTITHRRRAGGEGAAWRLSPGPPATARAAASGESGCGRRAPTSTEHGPSGCKFGRSSAHRRLRPLRAPQQKGAESRSLPASPPAGTRHMTAAAQRGSNASRAPAARPWGTPPHRRSGAGALRGAGHRREGAHLGSGEPGERDPRPRGGPGLSAAAGCPSAGRGRG